jgi:3-keto-5-aminohexanoate cleavage enzyme
MTLDDLKLNEEDYIWDFKNCYEWMSKIRKGLPPLIISVAITGGVQGKEMNPNLPETKEEQTEQAYEAYKTGASIVHIHARRPDDPSKVSSDPSVFREINGLIREKCPEIIINNSTGGGPGLSLEEKMAGIYANPELASLNCGPFVTRMTFPPRKPPLWGRDQEVHRDVCTPITYGDTERYAKAMLENGVKPELEVYNPGQFWIVNNLIGKDLIKKPYLIQLVMGFQTGSYPTFKNLLGLIDELPSSSIFEVIGVGNFHVPMIAMAILLGGHVRTGMEDTIYYRRGQLCRSNAELVERVVRLAKELNREIATPMQARKMLGISQKPSAY